MAGGYQRLWGRFRDEYYAEIHAVLAFTDRRGVRLRWHSPIRVLVTRCRPEAIVVVGSAP